MNKQYYLLLKRVFDIVVGFLMIVFLSPLLTLVAVLIKIESIGPILFMQIRIGLNGKAFSCYKFRSMVNNCDQKKYHKFIKKALNNEYGNGTANNHVEFKKNDDRLTKIGKIIRLTSIDELPQLFNVIKGEMSLIGPRPDVPESVIYYTDFEKKRLKVKPGITGWWQVSGRSHLSLSQMFALDNYYVENMSFKLDLKIFLKTIIIVITTKGAG